MSTNSSVPAYKTPEGRRTRIAFVAEAVLGYMISLSCSGAVLTLLIKELGVSDGLNGILSTVVSLACVVQFVAPAFIGHFRSIKKLTITIDTIQELLLAAMFLIPFLPASSPAKVALFIVCYLSAYTITNLIAPAKYNWPMCFVSPDGIARFSSQKEIYSLLFGFIYNYVLSLAIDRYMDIGDAERAFLLCARMIFFWMIFHTGSLVAASDVTHDMLGQRHHESLRSSMKMCFGNPVFRKLIVCPCIFHFATAFCGSYHNIYLLQELNCSVTFIAVCGIIGSLARALISMPLARFADKKGFSHSTGLGLVMEGCAFAMLAFWQPSNGKVLYVIYQFPAAIVATTTAYGFMNNVYEHMPENRRLNALSIYSATGGLFSFAGSLTGGIILNHVQRNGNHFLGLSLYGQQVLNALSCLMIVALIFYNEKVVEPLKRKAS